MEQISNATKKQIASLRSVKGRKDAGLFAVEGHRAISEMIGRFTCRGLYCTTKWKENAPEEFLQMIEKAGNRMPPMTVVTQRDMEKMSSMSTPQGILAVMELPDTPLDIKSLSGTLVLALDCLQDPGNMGTIIRLCDWFGVNDIVASDDTVDCFNPKVVQSAMGALARVRVHYVDDLAEFIVEMRELTGGNVISTDLQGRNLYEAPLPSTGVIVMGNEGRGVSEKVGREIFRHVRIPSYPERGGEHVESLNVAMATGIVLAEARRPRNN